MKNLHINFHSTLYVKYFRDLKVSFLLFTASLILGLSTATAQSHINKSSELKALLQQTEKEYVPQKWKSQLYWTMDSLALNIPILYVQLIGCAMQDQKNHLNQNSTHSEKFNNLNNEILLLIARVANAHNKTYFNKKNFQYCDPYELKEYYLRAVKGIFSDSFKQRYIKHAGKDITQVNIPFIMEDTGPNFIKKPRRNAIALLGQEAPRVEQEISTNVKKKYYGPEQIQGGCNCPLKIPAQFKEKGSFYLDCNGNPYDYTYVMCSYSLETGLIVYEVPSVNRKTHGIWRMWSTDDDYPGNHYLATETEYINGIKNGIHQFWHVDAAGRRYLYGKGQHKNGKLYGRLYYHNKNGTITGYRVYENGKQVGYTER